MLREAFTDIMKGIDDTEKNRSVHYKTDYNLQLPADIPVSSIAINLNQDLSCLMGKEFGKKLNVKSTKVKNTENCPNLSDHDGGVSLNINEIEIISDDDIIGTPNKITISIGSAVINSFVQLYDKYVADSSSLTINVASRTRRNLQSMLDIKHYQIWTIANKDNTRKRRETINSRGTALIDVSIWDRINYKMDHTSNTHTNTSDRKSKNNSKYNYNDNARARTANVHPKRSESDYKNGEEININGSNISLRSQSDSPPTSPTKSENGDGQSGQNVHKQTQQQKTLIQEQFENYLQTLVMSNNDDGNNINNTNSKQTKTTIQNEKIAIEWLFVELIKTMEIAVREISSLMNDSFSRFKKNQSVYQKAVQLSNVKR